MEYADDEHCDLLSNLFAVMVEVVLMHGNMWYGIQEYVIETLICFDDCRNVAVRQ
jgi:hypothetical protein